MQFRIQEQYLITQWSHVEANSKAEAIEIIEGRNACIDYYKEINCIHENTYWDTLEEVV